MQDRYLDLLNQGFMKKFKAKEKSWKACNDCAVNNKREKCLHIKACLICTETGSAKTCNHKREAAYRYTNSKTYGGVYTLLTASTR